MIHEILLPYGGRPYRLAVGKGATVVYPPKPPPAAPLAPLLERALDAPIETDRLENMAPSRGRVVVIVSDDTRNDPRRELVAATLARLPASVRVEIAIASGTHGRCDPRALGLGDEILRRVSLRQHDSRDDSQLAALGTTKRGTPIRVHRCLLDADLVVATGQIRPHYFAGYGAGAKSVFPGLGGEREIRINHALKAELHARAGEVEENPCRLDLEEAVSLLPTPIFLLNAIADAQGGWQDAVAGDVREAFRSGARRCAPLYTVRAPRSRVVVASDSLPLTGSLYQASKLVAAVAPVVDDGGIVVLVAQCPRGTGPIETVNHGIYDIGIRPRLPLRHRIVLVSELPPSRVEATYCDYAARVEDIIDVAAGPITIFPRAGGLIVEPIFQDGHELYS